MCPKTSDAAPKGTASQKMTSKRRLFGATDLADGGSTLRAGTLGHRTAILGRNLLRILHFLLCLALHAIAFHETPPFVSYPSDAESALH